jgi:hypothetical protein
MHADEQRALVAQRQARSEVVVEEGDERGVDGHRALAVPLGAPHADQPSAEVDVVPVQAEELGTAQAAVGEQGEQQAVALAAAREVALPDVRTLDDRQQPVQLEAIEDVGQCLSLLRRAQGKGGVALEVLVLHAEAKEALQRGDRARLNRPCM